MSLNVLASEAMTRLMVLASGWSAKTLLEKMFSEGKTYLGLALGIFGLVLIGWSIYKFVGKFMQTQASQQSSWFMILLAFMFGGLLLFGGVSMVMNIAQGAKESFEELGGGMILPYALTFLP